MKNRVAKVFLFITIAIVGTGIFGVIYFVSQFSATYPPIKEYSYSCEVEYLEQQVTKVINTDSKITYIVTDIVGGTNNNYAYYIDVTILDVNDTIKYNIKYGNYENSDGSYIKLIGAFNGQADTGGYKLDNDGVSELVEFFEQMIINRLGAKVHNSR